MACISKRRGRYVLDFYDQDGRRQRLTLPEGITKKEAREHLREYEDKVSRKTFVPTKRALTFREVAQRWLEHKKSNLRETTWEVYEINTRLHLSYFDPMKVSEINTGMVEKFISKKKTGGMNISTLRKNIMLLGQIMAYAVRHRMADVNPVRDAERPRKQGNIKDEGKKIRVLNPDEVRVFLEKVEHPKYQLLFKTAILSGVRQGELLGLKWGDVDFQKKKLHVQRTFNHRRFFTPKTKGSDRIIDISPGLCRELAELKLQSGGRDEDLIFPNEAGEPMNYSNMVQRYFHKGLKDAGLPRIRFHDLRHLNASALIEQGESITYIQRQLGHSSPTVTLNVYSHLFNETNPEAVSRLENTFFDATGHKTVTKEEKGITV